MSMNLQEYTKVKADEKFSVLRHKNGSEFKIAHKGLSPEIASRIHKMPMFASGGALGQLENSLSGPGGGGWTGNASTNLGAGPQAPAAAYAPGVQTPYTGESVYEAQNAAISAQGNLNGVASAANNYNGSQNLANAGQAGQNAYGQIAGINGAANQGTALSEQNNLNNHLQSASKQGIANQQTAAQGIQGAASQLQGVANGTGPNPAQAMLNQQTGQNVANQAALMAGQRGAGANAGLIARQAAQQGAATQQQAVGQGATMQAQQQLGALGQITGANQALAGVGQGQVAQEQTGVNALAQQGAQATGLQQSQNAQNAGIAQNQFGNQLGANTAAAQGAQNEQSVQNAALQGQNSNLAGQQASINSAGATLNNTGLQGKQGLGGGLLSSSGPLAGAAISAIARGGQIKAYEYGGEVGADGSPVGNMVSANEQPAPLVSPLTTAATTPVAPQAPAGPQSGFGQFLKNWAANSDAQQQAQATPSGGSNPGAAALYSGASGLGSSIAKGAGAAATQEGARGGKVKALVSEGEVVIPPKDAKNPAAAARDVARAKADGGMIKAANASQKATKSGNSYANDKIEKDLPVGGVVIPRSVMQGKDPVRGAAEFVKAVMRKKGGK